MKHAINIDKSATSTWTELESAVFDARFQLEYFEKPRVLSNVFDEMRGVDGKFYSITSIGKATMDKRTNYYSEAKREMPLIGRKSIEIDAYVREVPADQLLEASTGSHGQILANYAKSVAEAYKLQEDKIVWEALNSNVEDNKLINTVSVSADKLSLDTLLKASLYLDEKGVPSSDRYAIASSDLKDKILVMEKATSSNYVELKALVTGEFNEYLGFKWIWVNRDITGDDIADKDTNGAIIGKHSRIYFLQKECGRQVWGTKSGTSVYYEPKTYCNVINAVLQCGAALLTPHNVSCIRYKHS